MRCFSLLYSAPTACRTVIARATGVPYNLERIEKLVADKEISYKILLTFPNTKHKGLPLHNEGKRHRSLRFIAFEASRQGDPSYPVTHFLLQEGVHVAWGASLTDMNLVEQRLATHNAIASERAVFQSPLTESMHYRCHAEYKAAGGTRRSGSFVDADADSFVLHDDENVLNKVPFTFALAQSALIDATNETMTPTVRQTRQWSREVVATGTLCFSLRRLRQHKAMMTLVATDVLAGRALDKPAFFWYAASGPLRPLSQVYGEAQEHLEIDRRRDFLLERLRNVSTTMEFLLGEHHSGVSHRLEWVIILLILVEVLFALNHFVHDSRAVDEDDSTSTTRTTVSEA